MLDVPLTELLKIAPLKFLKKLATLHKVPLVYGTKTPDIVQAFSTHYCVSSCHHICVVFELAISGMLQPFTVSAQSNLSTNHGNPDPCLSSTLLQCDMLCDDPLGLFIFGAYSHLVHN